LDSTFDNLLILGLLYVSNEVDFEDSSARIVSTAA